MNIRRDKDFVDVVSELDYWQERFNHGSFVANSFQKECAPVIRLACEIYLRDPRGSDVSWVTELYRRIPPAITKLNAEITKQVAQLCWNRLNELNGSVEYSSPQLQ